MAGACAVVLAGAMTIDKSLEVSIGDVGLVFPMVKCKVMNIKHGNKHGWRLAHL